MTVLDTNTILRCILQDNEEVAALVDERMARDECLIPLEVVAEMVFVLLKVYCLNRTEIANSVLMIIRHKNVRVPNRGVVETALRYFEESKLDFVDCLMIGYAQVEGYKIFTFDKELNKMLSTPTEVDPRL